MRPVLLLALLACACGSDFGAETSYVCRAAGLTFETAGPVHADRVEHNAALARELLVAHLVVPPDAVDELFAETTIHVLDRGCLNEDSERTGNCIMGRSYAGSVDVYSNVTSYGFFHELMHRWDDKVGLSALSQWHLTWSGARYSAQQEWEERYSKTITIRNGATWAACGGPPKG